MRQDQVLGGSYSGLALLVGSWESPAPSLSLDFCKETPRPHRVGTQGWARRAVRRHQGPSLLPI